ncbi:MAG: hypothetical protein Ta2B_26560 [Termitinemataceae bacterium]|nr:MAG: hypothetical protein Ta2B_26560 [Termitinemataceae bacterium]
MSAENVKNIMQKYGKYDVATTKYQRFKADKDISRMYASEGTEEYLHILEKA